MKESKENTVFIPLLKPRQVSERLGISKSFVYKLIQLGEIPHVKIGTAIRIRNADLLEYIERNIQTIDHSVR